MEFQILKLRDYPKYKYMAAKWFNDKWSVPLEAYEESIQSSIEKDPLIDWYIIVEDENIIAGCGIIENDFHERKDLAPNIVALYVEEEFRNKKIARNLINYVVDDSYDKGFYPVYLITDHIGLYEKYGFEFITMTKSDNSDEISRLYGHSSKLK